LYLALKFIRIANSKLHINELQQHFKTDVDFTTDELALFYKRFDPDVKNNTVNWRVYTLIQSGVLTRVSKGKFSLSKGRYFVPELSFKNKSLYQLLQRQFPYAEKCIWNTSVLNEFMLHQPGRYYTLIEVEKDTTESVFHFLSETNKSIYLEPTADILRLYASKEKNALIVKPLVSEAPVQIVNSIVTTTIEKLLVDIFCNNVIFAAQQGSEMKIIFDNAFENYTINESKMLRYADRRRRKEAFTNYLNKIANRRYQKPQTTHLQT
jgi:hypothetical protein